jgi:hypothetical protein
MWITQACFRGSHEWTYGIEVEELDIAEGGVLPEKEGDRAYLTSCSKYSCADVL